MTAHPPSNAELAEKLDSVANVLLEQGANRFRAGAYQRAAATLKGLSQPVWQLYEADGISGLERLPGVGRTISRALQQMIRGGRWPLLERLQGREVAEHAFASIPSIGPKLAAQIHHELGVETLAELQAAALDGRLARLPAFGEKRVRAVRESLAARGRTRPSSVTVDLQGDASVRNDDLTKDIPVAELLDVDREYRDKAASGKLPRISPRRFNPGAEFWLPILHTDRGDHHYTALFSNTEHAHAMGTTHDWVVIYLEDHRESGHPAPNQHGRWTVITSLFGDLKGNRIVRGRESECREYYQK